ncbi:MAG: bifunctional adenosylcobinamide kinase/adenosylcobinamide-phosphate guanylyltransferase [Actinobacteria bacterium]|nr:bifunctional adenosylcobinamide kinase/adenosylcobinamide-phosphate guanylyltransferase [Actinomycetota bacterium]MCL6105344.1 bifunctional adenosylcobinamide kinase/adenosylcobinamide-phosphate guanylyltransferase [Actinomycetota bacterium]
MHTTPDEKSAKDGSNAALILVLGGARSGKSLVAEKIVEEFASVDHLATYVATVDTASGSTVFDDDMLRRIMIHKQRRPPWWNSVELSMGADLAEVLYDIKGPILVDSLGVWLAGRDHFAFDADSLTEALSKREAPTVVVSDEVGMSVHPYSEDGRKFRDALGQLNCTVSRVATEVLLVVAERVLRLEQL